MYVCVCYGWSKITFNNWWCFFYVFFYEAFSVEEKTTNKSIKESNEYLVPTLNLSFIFSQK